MKRIVPKPKHKARDNAEAQRARRIAETCVLRPGALVLAGVLGFAPGAAAQSCALCYTTASAAGAAGIHALHVGKLALLIPALLLFVGVFYLVFRRAVRAEAEA